MQTTFSQPVSGSTVARDFQPHVEEFLARIHGDPECSHPGANRDRQTIAHRIVRARSRNRHPTRLAQRHLPVQLHAPGQARILPRLADASGHAWIRSRDSRGRLHPEQLEWADDAPGGPNQDLHLDQAEHTPGIVININATHTLDDFTKENGATRIVPLSQLRTGKNRKFSDEESNTVQIEAPAGSVIAFNGGAIHAGSANRTQSLRRCAHAFYTRPWVKSQWDYTRSFTPEIIATLSDEQRRLFGFTSKEPAYDLKSDQIIGAAS